MARRLPLALALLLSLTLAGCLSVGGAPPTAVPGPTQNVTLEVSNEATVTHQFTVSVVAGDFEGIEVTYRNGSLREFPDADALADVPNEALDGAVLLRPMAADAVVRVHRLTPGSGVASTVGAVPRNATVLYAVSIPSKRDSLRGVGVVTCGDAEALHLVVRVNAEGAVEVHTTCRDD